MNTPGIGAFERLGSALNITAHGARQATNTALSNGIGNRLNCLEISLAGDSKARLNDIHTHFLKGLGNADFFIFGHRCARALLAVAQCGIKDY